MKGIKSTISIILIVAASLAIILPLPTGETEHLLTAAEAQDTTLTIYSGRSEELVGPVIERFEQDTGIEVEVVYGSTTTLALQIIEEGENSPADIFFAQDAGALGLLADEGLLDTLPSYLLESVDPRFRSPDDEWVGITGRARVVTYNTDAVSEEDLPDSILGFTAPEWSGRVGWAPTNGSLHSHLTAIRVIGGDDVMTELVGGLLANDAPQYPNNSAAVAGVISGEVDVALVNHYYVFRTLAENPDAPAANYYFPSDDYSNLVNIAGVAMLDGSDAKPLAQQFIAYLLSRPAQTYFAEETFEYPLLIGVEADERLLPLEDILTPEIDLSDLSDLQATLDLLDEVIAAE